jgi:3-oxoacyl-[acyl-carrier protein] reductase
MTRAGKTMLITGTRKGIGRHLAEHYVAQGYVVIGCSRTAADWSLPGYEHLCADIADEASVADMFHTIRRRHGGLDALINNAGIASMNHLLLTPLSTVREIFATNVFGTFQACREAARLMIDGGRPGRIVNFATVATPLRLEGESVYAASKAAVENLTRVMARELAGFRITVNAVGPTPVATDLIRSVPQAKIDALLARQAVRRLGEMRDVSNVVDFFLREESDFITGQVVYLGGVG